jgi:tetratricopeptide (TPR) repeat protein
VGFKTIHQYDHSRIYKAKYDAEGNVETGERSRPIQTCIWYPAHPDDKTPHMLFKEYTYLMATEESFAEPTEALREKGIGIFLSFYGSQLGKAANELNSETKAIKDAAPALGLFPVIIYGPSLNAPAFENSVLCEFLASHGYVVVSSPCMAGSSRIMKGDIIDLETQTRDMEFLIGTMHEYPNADRNRIAVMGFSFGGGSNVIVKLRNSDVGGVVCLDGMIRVNYANYIRLSPYARSAKMFDVPFLSFASNISKDEMIKYNLDTAFAFYDSMKYSDAFNITFHKLAHQDFGSSFIKFLDRESKSERAGIEDANEGYRFVCLYTLNFLNGYLKGDAKGLAYLSNNPEKNGVTAGILTVQSKTGLHTPHSLVEFAHALRENGFEKAYQMYAETRKNDPDFTLEENDVNLWGYALLQRNKTKEAVEVLKFNAQLYPQSFNAYDSLGEAYMVNGDKELAIKNYEKSIELNPNNTNGTRMLKILKEK